MSENFERSDMPEIDEEMVYWREKIEIALKSGFSNERLERLRELARSVPEERWGKIFMEAGKRMREELLKEDS